MDQRRALGLGLLTPILIVAHVVFGRRTRRVLETRLGGSIMPNTARVAVPADLHETVAGGTGRAASR